MTYQPTTYPEPQREKFKGLAWSGLILGIVGVVGSIIPIVNNLTAVAAVVGLILAVIAIFGTKKVVATIGGVLCILAVTFTVIAQQAFVNELDKTFGEVERSVQGGSASGSQGGGTSAEQSGAVNDVTLNGCTTSTNYGMTDVSADLDITNSTDSQASYWVTIGVDDTEGNRLSEINAIANNLQPGQSSNKSGQQAMTMLPEGPVDVTCSVVSVDRTPF